MPRGKIDRPPWKGNLAGLRELADWSGASRTAVSLAITGDPGFPEPLDHLSMGNVYSFADAVAALEHLGFTEHGGGRKRDYTKTRTPIQEADRA